MSENNKQTKKMNKITLNGYKFGDKVLTFPVLEFATIDEAHASSGGPDSTLKKVNAWSHAHGTRGEARGIIDDILVEISGIAPKSAALVKDGKPVLVDGKPAMERTEKEEEYAKRCLATTPALFEKLQAEVTRRCNGYKVKGDDGKEVEIAPLATSMAVRVSTGPKAKKLAQKYLDAALLFLTGKKNLDKLNKAMVAAGVSAFKVLPDVAKDGVENQTALGWLIKAWQDSQDITAGM